MFQASRLCSILLMGALATPSFASTFDLKTQVRWRAENDNRAFTGTSESYQYLRSRIGLAIASDAKDAKIFLQLQDSRRLGVPGSGTLANDDNLGLHQGYLKLSDIFHPGVSLTAGRFEVNHGDQRLLGSVGWHNVGRSVEGVALGHDAESTSFQLFQAKLVERVGQRPDQDTNLYGLYASWFPEEMKGNFDGFIYNDRDDRKKADSSDLVMNRLTFGLHSKRDLGEKADLNVTTALQKGNVQSADISAFLFAAEAGFHPIADRPDRVALGIDYASGDDSESDEYEAFNNLYYTGHKFRGAMDLFLASNDTGLVDLYGEVAWHAPHAWKVQAQGHLFKRAEARSSENDDKSLGFELDLSGTKKQTENVKIDVGASVFFPNEDAYPDADNALWAFLSCTVNLSAK